MTFLNPLILIGLIAAAIPLIIHLFNFRRPRKVNFSSLTFLKELQKSTMQRVRIKQWLLLLLRTLAIACLVLAFARPTMMGTFAGALGSRATSSVAIVFDNSLSMTLRDAGGAYLDQAKAVAAGIVEEMESGDEVYLITTADRSTAPPVAYTNRVPAQEALREVEVQPATTSVSRAVARAAARLAEAGNLNKEIYLISDLQESTFIDSVQAQVDKDIRTILLPIGRRTHANVAITDVKVKSRIIEVGQPVQIEATLVNYGQEQLEDYASSVYLEGERVAQAAVDLSPGVATTVAFTATPQRRGWLSGTVQIEDDAFAHDDMRHFVLHVPERRNVLVVQGEGQQTSYVELALSPELTQGRVAFDVETIPETALAAASLEAYDAIMLVGLRSLSSGETTSLVRYVEGGGGLLFFPHAGAAAQDYNALLQGFKAGTFSGFSGALGAGRSMAAFDRVDLEHPLFEGMFGQQGLRAEIQVESPDVYHAMNYTPSGGTEQTLIHLSNGFPFLQEIRHGRGAAFLMAVAPDARWSDLPVRGLFIPLLYRSMYYLSSSASVAGEQLVVGRASTLRLGGVSQGNSLRLISPDGEEFTPEQRNLFGAMLLEVDAVAARAPGIYEVYAGERLVRRIALNLDRRESDLKTLSPDQAEEKLAAATGAPVRLVDGGTGDPDRMREALSEDRAGMELWNVFLMLALVCLLAEMLVAKQWRPEAVSA